MGRQRVNSQRENGEKWENSQRGKLTKMAQNHKPPQPGYIPIGRKADKITLKQNAALGNRQNATQMPPGEDKIPPICSHGV